MIGFEKHVASDRDGWRGLLSEFVNVTDAQQAAAIGKWRVLLSGFLGMRNALQAAVGQPSRYFRHVGRVLDGPAVRLRAASRAPGGRPRCCTGGEPPSGVVGPRQAPVGTYLSWTPRRRVIVIPESLYYRGTCGCAAEGARQARDAANRAKVGRGAVLPTAPPP
jgi:hypothetical protein